MAKETEGMRMLAKLARDMEVEARSLTAERIQQDRVLSSASGIATSDVEKKYDLQSMGGA